MNQVLKNGLFCFVCLLFTDEYLKLFTQLLLHLCEGIQLDSFLDAFSPDQTVRGRALAGALCCVLGKDILLP